MKSRAIRTAAGLILLAGLSLQSCSKKDKIQAPVPGPLTMTADFQSSFEETRVQYFVDDWQVFDQQLTTKHDIGLAHSHESPLQAGPHKLRVIIDGLHSKDTTVDLKNSLYLGVNYNAGEIRFLLSEIRWMYR